jgi:hypothetical protein
MVGDVVGPAVLAIPTRARGVLLAPLLVAGREPVALLLPLEPEDGLVVSMAIGTALDCKAGSTGGKFSVL